MSQEAVETILRGYRAFTAGDLETIAEMLDPDVEWLAIGESWDAADYPEVLNVLRQRVQEGYRVELERCIPIDDKVVVNARFAGVEPDPHDDRPLQSRRYYTVGRYSAIVTIRDGRVTRVVEHPHLAAALEAAGVEDV